MNTVTIFPGLGRATRRGIRKCPKCGTVNGTRGQSCKNRLCDMVFSKSVNSKSSITDIVNSKAKEETLLMNCCKLITDEESEHHGGRSFYSVSSSKESGFVILGDTGGTSECYVKNCHGKTLEDSCSHIRACGISGDSVISTPLRVKQSVLNQMSISPDMKHEIWLCASKSGPLVQRVSQSTMVVRGRADEKHPLGYLHVTFVVNELTEPSMFCSCESNLKSQQRLCIHFYACVSVFASDSELSEEFGFFLALQQHTEEDNPDSNFNHVITILGPGDSSETIQIEVLDDENFHQILEQAHKEHQLQEKIEVEQQVSIKPREHPKKKQVSLLLRQQQNNDTLEPVIGPIDESNLNFSFLDWLSGATEMINESMHFQMDEENQNLTFQIPQKFFWCLRSRMCDSQGRQKLPDAVNDITRTAKPPLGTFQSFIFKLKNVVMVKKVFDTPKFQIELTRRFEKTKDGNFVHVPDDLRPSGEKWLKVEDEFKTVLKSGIMSPNQKVPFPFTLEWIPNLYPISQLGELSISFQFGHVKNNELTCGTV